MPGQERREGGRMRKDGEKSKFRLFWSQRGPNDVNKRQEVKTEDEGGVSVCVCVSDKGQKKVNLRNEI